jgi:hypothetical protein
MEVTGNDNKQPVALLVGLTESEYENIWLRLQIASASRHGKRPV